MSAVHDYRTAKRASIHQVADGLVHAGYDVSFISSRYSWLSKARGDSRLFLWRRSNQAEVVNGVRCYLWRTALHPFYSGNRLIDAVAGRLYPAFAELKNETLDQLIAAADYVIVESGAAAIYVRRIRRLNSRAKIIYYAADRLRTVGAHPFIPRRLVADQALIDHVVLRAERMKADFGWAVGRLYKIEPGINAEDFSHVGDSPYASGTCAAVSVGSMLFDASFFQIAAPQFPDVAFHVIGCGTTFEAPSNVSVHPEMPFSTTLPFVKHASVGIAPYLLAPDTDYLAESSLKLAQFEYFGLPAVCPSFAVGSSPARFGYKPSDSASICRALDEALKQVGRVTPRKFATWDEVALQILEPQQYGAAAIQ